MKTFGTLLIALLLALPAAHAYDEESSSQAELDQMLAPVALYPDTVLSHILIAATYPLEVVQAARWVRQNPGLEGDQAVAAVEHMDWDPSVKTLVAFPHLVLRMDEDLDWTRRLGDAFLVQEEQLVATIQALRQRAYQTGHLASSERVKVVHQREIIVIEPAHTHLVYVPYYDPWLVYGHWWHPVHPPVFWPYPAGVYGSVGVVYWSHGIRVSPNYFHTRFFWPQRHVVIVDRHHRTQPKRWTHEPRQRKVFAHDRARSSPRAGGFTGGPALRDKPGEPVTRHTQRSQRDWATERRENLHFNDRPATRNDSRQAGHGRKGERDNHREGSRERSQQRTESPRLTVPMQPQRSAPMARENTPVQRPRMQESQPGPRARSDRTRNQEQPSPPASRTEARSFNVPRHDSLAPPSPHAGTPARIPGPQRALPPGQARPPEQVPRNPGWSARSGERRQSER